MTCCPKCPRLGIFRHGSLAIFASVLAVGCLAPGKDPNLQGSAQKVSGSIAIGEERLSAPPVDVWIAPAAWGPVIDGVRLCLGAEKETFAANQPVRLLLYVQNLRRTALTFGAPDWRSPSIRSEDGQVTLTYAPKPDAQSMHQ